MGAKWIGLHGGGNNGWLVRWCGGGLETAIDWNELVAVVAAATA